MSRLESMSKQELIAFRDEQQKKYDELKQKNLKLDMSRGKPGADQLALSMGMLDAVSASDTLKDETGLDCRNYGGLDGIVEAKKLFGDLLGVTTDEIIVGGNSSLNLMYDTVMRCMYHGAAQGSTPWSAQGKVKFLAPCPGYDRHFAICEHFGIEMIPVEMHSDGPDMNTIEALVANDASIKGIWCVPKYSNPDGITYSDDVVRRFAALKPKAQDFRIFWDNAYCVHDLYETSDSLLDLFAACKQTGNPDMPLIFASTSKISFSGAGVAVMAGSKANMDWFKKLMSIQTIGPDKINQLRHVRFYKNVEGILSHMKKHAELLRPKFEEVLRQLSQIAPLGIATWEKPNGGYFISLNTLDGCAKRVVLLCKEAGVVLTPAGVTFPYGKDPRDRNIRIAPTFPPIHELTLAMEVLCVSLKLASAEKLLAAGE